MLVRKDICPFLVLRVSLRCLIYKVHTATRGGSFIVPHPIPVVNTFFQISLKTCVRVPFVILALSLVALSLTSASSDPLRWPLAQALGYLTIPQPLCQHLFSLFSKFFS